MNTLTTLNRLRAHLGLSSSETGDDARLLVALQSATSMIERRAGRRFSPRVATIPHSIPLHDASELLLRDDLLALTSLTNGDGTAIESGDMLLLPGGERATSIIRLINGVNFVYEASPQNAIQVSGIWGWHEKYASAWLDSADTVQDDPLTANSASIVVMDADGTDSQNVTPRFAVGQLLRIEDEFLSVISVDSAANTLTVQRAANGTTAAAHENGTSIQIYQPPEDVAMLCLRWATWLYQEPDGRTDDRIPYSLLDGLNGLKRVSVQS